MTGVFAFEQGDWVSCDTLMFAIIGRILHVSASYLTALLLLLYCRQIKHWLMSGKLDTWWMDCHAADVIKLFNLPGSLSMHLSPPPPPPPPLSLTSLFFLPPSLFYPLPFCLSFFTPSLPLSHILIPLSLPFSFAFSLLSSLLLSQVLCLGALVHPDIHFDKPPPKHPFKADLLGELNEWHVNFFSPRLIIN